MRSDCLRYPEPSRPGSTFSERDPQCPFKAGELDPQSPPDPWPLLTSQPPRHGIAAAVSIRALLFGTLVALLLTAVQLALNHRSEMSALEDRLANIGQTHADGLARSLSARDATQLQAQLDGLLRDPSVRAVEVRGGPASADALVLTRGPWQGSGSPLKEVPLRCCGETAQRVGTLRIEAALGDVHRRLRSQALVILLSNAAFTVALALFVSVVLRRLAARHLVDIAAALRRVAPQADAEPVRLQRKPGRGDELEHLVDALNGMQARLHQHAAELRTSNARMATILDNIPDLAWVKDAEGRYVMVNRALATTKGFAEPGQMILSLIHI